MGALVRRRNVPDAATLLRLALAYGPGGMSLRSAAAWAGMNDVASLSDVRYRTPAVPARTGGCTPPTNLRLRGSRIWRLATLAAVKASFVFRFGKATS
ncbi:MAG: hypothetical protein E5Y60_27700 [Mesorhizobium sp.]|nr:MAG: hypothetical protein E5Y60_27700 [Mesorhizobium sp.]